MVHGRNRSVVFSDDEFKTELYQIAEVNRRLFEALSQIGFL
jgi:hypothetical protein